MAHRSTHRSRTSLSCHSGVVLWLWLFVAAGVARGDDFDRHADRAFSLYEQRRYDEAIGALQAAYEVRQWPRLLLNIAKCHLRMGRAKEALGYYQRYRQVRPSPDLSEREELIRGEVSAQALLASVQLAPAPAPRERPRFELRRAWWFWTSLGVVAGGAVAAGLLIARPWPSAAWQAVPEGSRRQVAY